MRWYNFAEVSIHALLAECDFARQCNTSTAFGFNPRTPCGVRPMDNGDIKETDQFQSTHSLRSATKDLIQFIDANRVSIHALLAECDLIWVSQSMIWASFNPRTPCGVRRRYGLRNKTASVFQSTHSLRSATDTQEDYLLRFQVSIHALLAECDLPHSVNHPFMIKFQSTHSLRSATSG